MTVDRFSSEGQAARWSRIIKTARESQAAGALPARLTHAHMTQIPPVIRHGQRFERQDGTTTSVNRPNDAIYREAMQSAVSSHLRESSPLAKKMVKDVVMKRIRRGIPGKGSIFSARPSRADVRVLATSTNLAGSTVRKGPPERRYNTGNCHARSHIFLQRFAALTAAGESADAAAARAASDKETHAQGEIRQHGYAMAYLNMTDKFITFERAVRAAPDGMSDPAALPAVQDFADAVGRYTKFGGDRERFFNFGDATEAAIGGARPCLIYDSAHAIAYVPHDNQHYIMDPNAGVFATKSKDTALAIIAQALPSKADGSFYFVEMPDLTS